MKKNCQRIYMKKYADVEERIVFEKVTIKYNENSHGMTGETWRFGE